MSIQAIRWAHSLNLPPSRKLTLLVLADFANKDGLAWPSTATLMEHTGLSERSIKRIRADLVRVGLLAKVAGERSKLRLCLEVETFESARSAPSNKPESAKFDTFKVPDPTNESAKSCTPPIPPYIDNHQRTTKEPSLSCSSPSAPSAFREEFLFEEIPEIPPKSLSEPPPKPASGPKTDPIRGFDEFWKAYPRKISKPQALRAWAKALAGTKATQTLPALPPATPERIIAGLRASSFDGEAKFIPHPATWLNGRRWEDVEVSKNDATPEENRIRQAERRWEKACDEWIAQISQHFGSGERPKRPVLADFIAEELAA